MKTKNNVLGSKKAVVVVDETWRMSGHEALSYLCDTCRCKNRHGFVIEAKSAGIFTAALLGNLIESWDTMTDYYEGTSEFDNVVELLEKGFTDKERKAFWVGFDSVFPCVYQELLTRVVDIISESREDYKELSKEYIYEEYTSTAPSDDLGSIKETVRSLLNFAVSDTICFMFDGTIDACSMDEIYYLRVLELLSNTVIGGYIRWHLVSKTNFYKELLLEQGRDINEF